MFNTIFGSYVLFRITNTNISYAGSYALFYAKEKRMGLEQSEDTL